MNVVDQKMAKRLRQARLAAGNRTVRDAVDRHGFHYPTYAGHENGARGFADDAVRYASAYKVDVGWLMTGRGQMRPGGERDELHRMVAEIPAEQLPYVRGLLGAIVGK